MERFDVIVIGTGVSGETAAAALAAAGKRVAAVDRREFGGTCSLRGCEPKKVLFNAAEAVERARGQASGGIVGHVAVDWPALIAFKRTFTDAASARIEQWLTSSGVTPLHGTATFIDPETLRVGEESFRPQHVVIATGARPAPLDIPGAGLVIDSERFMADDRLGARIAFIGGGYISVEFAHIAAAAGADVVVLGRGPHLLKGFDPDLADLLARGYRDAGVDVRTGTTVAEVRRVGAELQVVLGDGSVVACDTAVHGAGRVPDLEALDLAAGGVAFGRQGVTVDGGMRSVSNPRVYAVGDAAASGPMLTPVGITQGRIAARNISVEGSTVFDDAIVPSVVFADPPLASVGLSESDARARGLDVDVRFHDSSTWVSSRRVGVRASGAKIILERGSDLIVGAHLLGHSAEEVINLFALAMRCGTTATALREAMWSYPTSSYEIVDLL